eukprot:6422162-Heterocapsa_arctica.AAC.1
MLPVQTHVRPGPCGQSEQRQMPGLAAAGPRRGRGDRSPPVGQMGGYVTHHVAPQQRRHSQTGLCQSGQCRLPPLCGAPGYP